MRQSLETALARNRAFAAAGGHEGATVFPTLRLLVITCLDPRVDPAHVLGLDLGDAMVVRNGGGRVTPEVIQHVAFVGQLAENAVPEGPLFEVAVIHHTAVRSRRPRRRRLPPPLRAADRRTDESALREYAVLDPAATVAADVDRLRSAAAISRRVTRLGPRLRRRHRPGAKR